MMTQQQPIRVVVEKKGGCFSGCGTALGVLLLIGLAIKYWYVALSIVVLVAVIGVIVNSQQRKQARRRPGPRDPWLDEVAVALADYGLREQARNTGAQLGGAPLEGDIGLQDNRFSVFVNLFSTNEFARQAEIGLRAKPEVQNALAKGHSAIKTDGRVVYVANGRGRVVDDFRLDEVIRVVAPINVPPPRHPVPAPPPTSGALQPAPSVAQLGAAAPDALEQLRKLGELHSSGVPTDAEFEAKKAELLRRI
jgi:hypothetical protein